MELLSPSTLSDQAVRVAAISSVNAVRFPCTFPFINRSCAAAPFPPQNEPEEWCCEVLRARQRLSNS
jgi:hypothetical protein